MHSLELTAEVTSNHEIHLKLPESIRSQPVRVIVLYEQEAAETNVTSKRQFGQFRNEPAISDDFDEPLPESFWTEHEG